MNFLALASSFVPKTYFDFFWISEWTSVLLSDYKRDWLLFLDNLDFKGDKWDEVVKDDWFLEISFYDYPLMCLK